MAPEDIRSLPVSVLKDILFHNHVNARLLIEKSDLVEKVTTLIADERRERERQEMFRQMEEEQERLRQAETQGERLNGLHLDSEQQPPRSTPDVAPELTPETELEQRPGSSDNTDQPIPTATKEDAPRSEQTTANNPTPQPMSGLNSRPAMAMGLERNGLCVICQDEEANIAIVDCGWVVLIFHCFFKTEFVTQAHGHVQNVLRPHNELHSGVPLVQNSYSHGGSVIKDF